MPISLGKSGAAVAFAVAVLFCGVAQAQFTTLQQRQQNDALHKRLGIPLPVIERWQRSQDLQRQQQRYRAEDRRTIMTPQPNAVIPRMRPTCQYPVRGNAYMQAKCR